MRAKEFLQEAEVKPYKHTPMYLDQAMATLNKYCHESFGMLDHPLWRGMRNHNEPIFLVDPSTGKRESNNTSNYYTNLIDSSPYMKGWPKRSASMICSSGFSYADGYKYGGESGTYALFPFDGVPIAVCPSRDMWETKVRIPELGINYDEDTAMNDFNRWLEHVMLLPTDITAMAKKLNKPNYADTVIRAQEDSWYSSLNNKTKAWISVPGNPPKLIDLLYKALSPAMTGFSLMTVPEFVAAKPKNKECWVGGPLVAIRKDVYEDIVSAVKRKAPTASTTAQPATLDDPKDIRIPRDRAGYYRYQPDGAPPAPKAAPKKKAKKMVDATIADPDDELLRALGEK